MVPLLLLLLRVVAPRLTLVPEPLVRLVLTLVVELLVLRFTCGVVVVLRLVLVVLRLVLTLELELLVLRFTCGVVVVLRLLLELPWFTWGVAELLRLMVELLLVVRLTVGADAELERETAADWLLLVVLPPCERLRPWAEASDALKIRHPMRAKLIMIFVTEVFIIVMY